MPLGPRAACSPAAVARLELATALVKGTARTFTERPRWAERTLASRAIRSVAEATEQLPGSPHTRVGEPVREFVVCVPLLGGENDAEPIRVGERESVLGPVGVAGLDRQGVEPVCRGSDRLPVCEV